MSVDYHLYTKDDRPITASELIGVGAVAGELVCVLSSFRDWSEYAVVPLDEPLKGELLVCLVSAQLANSGELIEQLITHRPVGPALEANDIRVCHLSVVEGPDWKDNGEAEELGEVYGRKYVSYRRKAKLHYEATGSALMIPQIEVVLKLIESLRGGLYEDPQEGTYTIDGKEVPWTATPWTAEELAEAKLTDRRCTRCKKPLPSYRKTCKWCGLPVSTANK